MKKLITIFLILFSLSGFSQVSDDLIGDTIDLWIVPNGVKSITAAKLNTILNLLNDNKLNKDSLSGSSFVPILVSSTNYTSAAGSQVIAFDDLAAHNDTLRLGSAVGRTDDMIYVARTDLTHYDIVITGTPALYYKSAGYTSVTLSKSMSGGVIQSDGTAWYVIGIWYDYYTETDTRTTFPDTVNFQKPVGICTDYPTEMLDVVGNVKGDTAKFNIYNNLPYNGTVTGTGTVGYLTNWNGTTAIENSPIYTDGINVGVGATTLDSKFVVASSGLSSRVLTLGYNNYTETQNAAFGLVIDSDSRIGLSISTQFGVWNERVRINNLGKVGINNIAPDSTLTVNGSGHMDNLLLDNNLNLVTTTAAAGQIKMNGVTFLHKYGTRNIYFGDSTGNYTLSGHDNTAIGHKALYTATTGYTNTAVGAYALQKLTSGYANTAVGYGAMGFATVTGEGLNSAFGYKSLYAITSGRYNTAIGDESLRAITTTSNNTGLGYEAGYSATGTGNLFLGYLAGSLQTTGDNKLYIDNSNSTTPLIGGDFSTNLLTVNGTLQLATASDTATAVLIKGAIIFNAADSSFYGCRSTVATKKWYKLDN